MEWIVSYDKLKEYGLDDPRSPSWVGFAIRHRINSVSILAILAMASILIVSYMPLLLILNQMLNVFYIFIAIFFVYYVFSLAHSRILTELFLIEHLLRDDELISGNKLKSKWTPKQMAAIGCILSYPEKFDKKELAEKIGLSERQIHQYQMDGLLERGKRGYIAAPVKFRITGFVNPKNILDLRPKKRAVENILSALFKTSCIFQYNLLAKRMAKKHPSKLRKYASKIRNTTSLFCL